MGWDQLKAILDDDKRSAQQQSIEPPVACPIDGEPLEVGLMTDSEVPTATGIATSGGYPSTPKTS